MIAELLYCKLRNKYDRPTKQSIKHIKKLQNNFVKKKIKKMGKSEICLILQKKKGKNDKIF